MTEEDREKFTGYHRMLLDYQQVFENVATRPEPFNIRVEGEPVRKLAEDVQRVEEDFPGLLPPFNMDETAAFRSLKGRQYYENARIRSYLTEAIARLEAALGTGD